MANVAISQLPVGSNVDDDDVLVLNIDDVTSQIQWQTIEGFHRASTFRLIDNTDLTKKLAFALSGLTTATTRTWTVPDMSGTLVGTDTTQTLTGKTLTSPTIAGGTITTPVITSATGIGQSIVVRKTADESMNSSEVLQDDDALLVAIAANEEWLVHFDLLAGAQINVNGIKIGVTVPAAATVITTAVVTSVDTQLAPIGGRTTSSGLVVSVTPAFNAQRVIARVWTWVLNGANPGNVQLQWAQENSDIGNLTVGAGSHLIAHRIA